MNVKLKASMDLIPNDSRVLYCRVRHKGMSGSMQFQTQRRPPKPQLEKGNLQVLYVLTILLASQNLWHESNWKDPNFHETFDRHWIRPTTEPEFILSQTTTHIASLDKSNPEFRNFMRPSDHDPHVYCDRIQCQETVNKPKRFNRVQKTKVKNKVKVSLLRRHLGDFKEKIRAFNLQNQT